MGRFIDKLRSCCVCCRKKSYEKNEFNTYGDITSENGIENKEMVEIQTTESVVQTVVLWEYYSL